MSLNPPRRKFLKACGALSLSALAGCTGTEETTPSSEATSQLLATAVLYKSPTCGCCTGHAEHLEANSGETIETTEVSDMNRVKAEFNVPQGVRSCHTTQIGDYYVEGHVPMAAINKLLDERPDIAGIALPRMPAGSPGMGGRKEGPFTIYAVSTNGSIDEFMRV